MCGGGGDDSSSSMDIPGVASQPTGMIGGQEVNIAGSDENIAGIVELARGLAERGVELPEQILAQFTPDQLSAFNLAQEGIGSYQPFLQGAQDLTAQGVTSLDQAQTATRDLAGQLPGAVQPGLSASERAQRTLQNAGSFGLESARAGMSGLAPSAAMDYMNPYEDAAVQRAMADIGRQGDIQKQSLAANAVQAGAFGGSRAAVAEQELNRNVLQQQGQTAAQMRNAGYQNASNLAMQAAQSRAQIGQMGAASAGNYAQAAGNLGLQSSQLGLSGIQAGLGAQQQAAGLGQGVAGLGQQMAGLGQLGQQLNLQDLNTMSTIGAQQQAQTQAGYDTSYQNQYSTMMQPYQQLAFLSDITTGAPSGQMTTNTQPGPSIGSQLLGGGIAAYGAYKSFQ